MPEADGVARRALLLFHDDSSLTVARRLADQVAARGWRPTLAEHIADPAAPARLSPRQRALGLGPHAPGLTLVGRQAADPALLGGFAMVASAKYPMLFRDLWRWGAWRFGRRPCFVGLYPGLELTPEAGWRIRRFADVLCCVSGRDRDAYLRAGPAGRPAHQVVLRYHPSLVRRAPLRLEGAVRRLVFFPQSIVPATAAGRLDVLRILAEAARAHPGVAIVIKLRHRPDENRAHTHVEAWAYPALAAALAGGPPANLSFSDDGMEAALAGADLAVTVSSTAGAEALALGVPALFLVDHADAAADPYQPAIRRVLAGSGLAAGAADVIALARRAPDPAWAADLLSQPGDLDAVLAAVDAFHAAPPPRPAGARVALGRAGLELDLALRRAIRSARRWSPR